ncbi:antiterminator Q family protein [Pasteurella multocida]|uniref:antiterminator Q family protein n=1 Tax=Pasteurella multocida TaxID=747 RepID=UPI000868FA86|nr:antiterminator Q family protein [Pasteurella multocida]ODN39116.1 antitermination protein [Pasteurella multocida]
MTKKFSDLTLTEDQEYFVDKWMDAWGNWIKTEKLDKTQFNIIARLMQSVTPAEPSEAMCDDETGMMISEIVDQFFAKNDRTLRFIIFSYYVNKCTINKIAVTLRKNSEPIPMKASPGKSKIRVPSILTMRKNVEKELKLAKAIIHELLVTGFVILQSGSKRAVNVKIKY